MLQAVQTAAEHAASSTAPQTWQTAIVVIVNAGVIALGHVINDRKGKSRESTQIEQASTLTQIKDSVDRLDAKLETFTEEQRATNHQVDKRISEVSAHVIGPDGENGLRSRVKKLEDERDGSPRHIGEYAPPRRA